MGYAIPPFFFFIYHSAPQNKNLFFSFQAILAQIEQWPWIDPARLRVVGGGDTIEADWHIWKLKKLRERRHPTVSLSSSIRRSRKCFRMGIGRSADYSRLYSCNCACREIPPKGVWLYRPISWIIISNFSSRRREKKKVFILWSRIINKKKKGGIAYPIYYDSLGDTHVITDPGREPHLSRIIGFSRAWITPYTDTQRTVYIQNNNNSDERSLTRPSCLFRRFIFIIDFFFLAFPKLMIWNNFPFFYLREIFEKREKNKNSRIQILPCSAR